MNTTPHIRKTHNRQSRRGTRPTAGLRTSTGVIVQSGEVWEVHHFAVLLGYGATAINPYLALETISSLFPNDPVTAAANYISAVDKGLM